MNDRAPAALEELSPNQIAKQQQIVDAAMAVLAEKGLAACTAREIAAAAPLTKSAIHYYFADLDVLIDRAMAQLVRNFAANLADAATAKPDAKTAFWSIVETYLATFRDRPNVTYLWFEYWVDAARKGRQDAIDQMSQQVITVLHDALKQLALPDPETAARHVFVLLLGEVIAQPAAVTPTDQTCRRIAAMVGLEAPLNRQ
ncbi:TetR/AcrR family transcriptional regulator [Enemella evansiae]|uniref:TetR/AcrR family transcriptional regulator n=1 Tax=Enemella evansiae TaxID=2016499 RepID=UPI0015C606EE|nr:TetR family transcriptional regulator [Enemella evansiae]